jgi:hypothetical protein
MTAKWGICVLLAALLFISTGCRTRQPNLKPDTTAETLKDPPPNAYMSASLPKQALAQPSDPGRAAIDPAKGMGTMPMRSGGPMMPGMSNTGYNR